jgi:capsular polysaccharide biosynthesis protein
MRDIENDPEWCGWLRRNDPEFAVKREAAQVVAQLDETLAEPIRLTPMSVLLLSEIANAKAHPHANVLKPARFTNILGLLGWGLMMWVVIGAVAYFSVHIGMWIARMK